MDIGIYADGTQSEQAYQRSVESNYSERYADIFVKTFISTEKQAEAK